MEPLVSLLIAWIAATHGLPPPPEPPAVERAAAVALATLEPGAGAAGRNVLGRYDTRTATIYLTEDWDGGNFVDVSVLVHELVHHFQTAAGERFACPEAREALAYAVQADWLALFGADLESAFGIDPVTLMFRTRCLPW